MRHLEFCQNKFPCETASSVNTVAQGAAESVVTHEAGCRTRRYLGGNLSEMSALRSVRLSGDAHRKCDYLSISLLNFGLDSYLQSQPPTGS